MYIVISIFCLRFLICSDPYCKIKLFRGDREFGEIDTVVTDTIKKVRVLSVHILYFNLIFITVVIMILHVNKLKILSVVILRVIKCICNEIYLS